MKKSILAVAVGAAFGALNWLDRQATDKSRSFTFGANFFSTQVTSQKAAPPVRVRVRELHGRVRYALGLWPATNPAPQVADQIFFVRLPKGVAIVGHLSRLSWNAGTAASTMTFGDSASTNAAPGGDRDQRGGQRNAVGHRRLDGRDGLRHDRRDA
jgi:hypothetical protein